MGDIMLPTVRPLTLNFALDVQHTLKVDIPPGGNRVELVPQGGWQSWLTQGRKPTRLFRDQTFNLSASSRFKMQLECQYTQDGQNCSVREPVSGHAVPLNVSVSLPHGLSDASGQPVSRRPLRLDGSGTAAVSTGHLCGSQTGNAALRSACRPGGRNDPSRRGSSILGQRDGDLGFGCLAAPSKRCHGCRRAEHQCDL